MAHLLPLCVDLLMSRGNQRSNASLLPVLFMWLHGISGDISGLEEVDTPT